MDQQAMRGFADAFDRILGSLHGLPDVTNTKPSTVRSHSPILSSAQTYIVQTYRRSEEGDTIFLECISGEGSFRIALPPKVAETIARQHDALTTTVRRNVSRRIAQERKDAGLLPGFMKGKKKK